MAMMFMGHGHAQGQDHDYQWPGPGPGHAQAVSTFKSGPPSATAKSQFDPRTGEPKSHPSCARATAGSFLYRVLRKEEAPWNMRKPVDTTGFTHAEFRTLLLKAVATGNVDPSPFLHATTKLAAALNLQRERGRLYSNWLVRWPRMASEEEWILDLTTTVAQKRWLTEEKDDTDFMVECLGWGRMFGVKDSEVVVLKKPSFCTVDVWIEDKNCWVKAMDHQRDYAASSQSVTFQVAIYYEFIGIWLFGMPPPQFKSFGR